MVSNTLVMPRQSSDADAAVAGDEDALMSALENMRNRGPSPAALEDVAAILRSTRSRRVRNTAALALADSGRPEMSEPLVATLRDERVAGEAGTLLFALGELGGNLPLDVAAHLIAKGSYEARAETLTFFELDRVDRRDAETCRSAKAVLAALSTDTNADIAEAAELALCLLDATV